MQNKAYGPTDATALHCPTWLQGYIGEAQAAVTASKAGELSGEVVPLRGVPKGDVEMAERTPTALTLKAVNPMDSQFVGSLEVTQEAAAELAEGARSSGAPETSGHQESESLIQVCDLLSCRSREGHGGQQTCTDPSA